jgi:hypothetical protein
MCAIDSRRSVQSAVTANNTDNLRPVSKRRDRSSVDETHIGERVFRTCALFSDPRFRRGLLAPAPAEHLPDLAGYPRDE